MNVQTLFPVLARAMRTQVNPAGVRGFDLAVRTATQAYTPTQLQNTLSKMTPAEKSGFATGTALKIGVKHPEFQRAFTNLASHAPLNPAPASVQMGADPNNPFGYSFTPAQIAQMTAAYNANPPDKPNPNDPLSAAKMQMAQATKDIVAGKAPANAQEAAMQQTVVMLGTGMAIGAGGSYLGIDASNSAIAAASTHPVIATGLTATPTGVRTAANAGILTKLLAWFKALFGVKPAVSVTPPKPVQVKR